MISWIYAALVWEADGWPVTPLRKLYRKLKPMDTPGAA